VRRRTIVELHEKRRAEGIAAVIGDEMAVADDALTEALEVALLLRNEGAPGGFLPRLVPAVDRPLRRLCAVVFLQRVALQTMARIARQISGGLFAWHVISPIRRLWMNRASGSIRACQLNAATYSGSRQHFLRAPTRRMSGAPFAAPGVRSWTTRFLRPQIWPLL